MNKLSLDQLNKSLERRVKHLMIQNLEQFENLFPEQDNTRSGQIFKSNIRTSFNDVIRAQRDELLDYEIEYRPLRITENNTLAMTQTFLQTVQKIDFGFKKNNVPYIRIYSDKDHIKVLDAIRLEFGAGVLWQHQNEDKVVLEIVGVQPCIDYVLPILDKYSLHNVVRSLYKQWRDKVVEVYTGDRDD